MLKRFLDGVIFGGGFAIAFVAVWHLYTYYALPSVVESKLATASRYDTLASSEQPSTSADPATQVRLETEPFHEMPIDAQIDRVSVIAIARFEQDEKGQPIAVLDEILKKDDGVDFYYTVGEEMHSERFMAQRSHADSDGIVMFFVGSPARQKYSITYSGERISGLGDIPVRLFREKCGAEDAQQSNEPDV